MQPLTVALQDWGADEATITGAPRKGRPPGLPGKIALPSVLCGHH